MSTIIICWEIQITNSCLVVWLSIIIIWEMQITNSFAFLLMESTEIARNIISERRDGHKINETKVTLRK